MACVGRIIGRSAEQAALSDLIDDVQQQGGALIVRGEAGMGKTALLDWAAERATERGYQILRITGSPAESELTFAGLHQLLGPILAHREVLPAAQRDAVGALFGLPGGATAEQLLISVAALGMVSDAAEIGPLVLIADDLHWLDQASVDVLSFIGRRLRPEPVVLLLGVRTGEDRDLHGSGLAELDLGPLPTPASTELLDAHSPLPLVAHVRNRLLDTAAGCPLALIELPSALTEAQAAGAEPILFVPTIGTALHRIFAERMARLPEPTRTLLLIIAACDGASIADLLQAARKLGVAPEALEPAERSGLVQVGHDRLWFRHPLIRSAVYEEATFTARLAVHRALAEVLEPARAAWHLATVADGPDAAATAALTAAADTEQRRGGPLAAVAPLTRAAELSPDPAIARLLRMRALQAAVEAGSITVLRSLLDAMDAAGVNDDGLLDYARGAVSYIDGDANGAARALTAAARATPPMSRKPWEQAIFAKWQAGDLEGMTAIITELDTVTGPVRPEEAMHQLPAVINGQRWDPPSARVTDVEPWSAVSRAAAASMVNDHPLALRILGSVSGSLRTRGELGLLVRALVIDTDSRIALGDPSAVEVNADEGIRLGSELGFELYQVSFDCFRATAAAWRGDREGCLPAAKEALDWALSRGNTLTAARAVWAMGVLELSTRNPESAVEHLLRLINDKRIAHFTITDRAMPDLVEAALLTERIDDIRAAATDFIRRAEGSGIPFMVAAARYAAAALAVADDNDPDTHFEQAIEASMAAGAALYTARVQLGHGWWLRRRRRVAEAREPLRAALEGFAAAGSIGWADETRSELTAAGARSGESELDAVFDVLTPHELQIARLAAQGLSNRAIGAKLFISPRTVGYHLYKIFPKLGIGARGDLRDLGL